MSTIVGLGHLDGSPDGEPGAPEAVNGLGGFMGAMAQSGNASPDVTPPAGDLRTAELLGERVARVTKRFRGGAGEDTVVFPNG